MMHNNGPELDVKIPYIAVPVTAEESKQIEFREMEFYSVNGKTLFEVKDKDGKPTGEYVFYVMFKS